MSSFRHIDEEAFGYKTAIDHINPTFGNAERQHPYDGGNALVENSENLDGSGSLVLSSFDVHLRVNHPGSDRGKDRWKIEFVVDRSRDVIRPKTSYKKKRKGKTDGETVRLRELAVVLARAEQAAVEFVRDTVSGEGEFSFRYFDTDVDEAIAETNGANMIELGGLPDQKNEPVTDGGVETVEVEDEFVRRRASTLEESEAFVRVGYDSAYHPTGGYWFPTDSIGNPESYGWVNRESEIPDGALVQYPLNEKPVRRVGEQSVPGSAKNRVIRENFEALVVDEGDMNDAFESVESARHSIETVIEELLPSLDPQADLSEDAVQSLSKRLEMVQNTLYRVEDDLNSAEVDLWELRDDQDGEQ